MKLGCIFESELHENVVALTLALPLPGRQDQIGAKAIAERHHRKTSPKDIAEDIADRRYQ